MRSRIFILFMVIQTAAVGRSAGQELSYNTEHIDIIFSNMYNESLIARTIDDINPDLIFVLRKLQTEKNAIPRYSVLYEGDYRQMYFFLSKLSSFSVDTHNPGAAVICGVRVEKNIDRLGIGTNSVFIFESDGSHFSSIGAGAIRRMLKAFRDYCDELGVNYTDRN